MKKVLAGCFVYGTLLFFLGSCIYLAYNGNGLVQCILFALGMGIFYTVFMACQSYLHDEKGVR